MERSMTSYRPCMGCTERAGCEIKVGISTALRKQPVTSVRVKCNLPFTKHFPPGTRVKVMVWDWRDHCGDEQPSAQMVPATVICRSTKKRDKALCLLDTKIQFSSDDETEFCTAYPKDLVRLDEPLADVCGSCGRGLVHDACGCWQKDHDSNGGF
jgi:hypothetical protein